MVGVVPASYVSADTLHDFPFVVSTMGVGGGAAKAMFNASVGAPAMTIGILIDADTRQVIIIDHNAPSVGAIRIDGLPGPVKVAMQYNKHDVTATLRLLDNPLTLALREKAEQFVKNGLEPHAAAATAGAPTGGGQGGGGAGGAGPGRPTKKQKT